MDTENPQCCAAWSRSEAVRTAAREAARLIMDSMLCLQRAHHDAPFDVRMKERARDERMLADALTIHAARILAAAVRAEEHHE